MPVSEKRLAEIAAIADEDIDTSELPEADESWFKGAKPVMPHGGKSAPRAVDDRETRRSPKTGLDSTSRPRPVS